MTNKQVTFNNLVQDLLWSLPGSLRRLVKRTIYFVQYYFWKLISKNNPLPHAVKVWTILNYAKRYKTSILVETGTYKGDTIDTTLDKFNKVYSIELAKSWHDRAKSVFGVNHNVSLHQGNSTRVLPKVVKKLDRPTLFWLDAHYSGDGTARAKKDTPIWQELTAISKSKISGNVILIDDARLFTGKGDYPNLADLKKKIKVDFPHKSILVLNDIIRIF